MSNAELHRHVEAVRRFSRFYTRKIGVLHEGLLGSELSLSEGRVLYEIAHHDQTTASELGRELGLDAGYLSRILKNLEQRDLVNRAASKADARQFTLSLTANGQAAFATINARSQREVQLLLAGLGQDERSRLVGAMQIVQKLMVDEPRRRVPYILRAHQPGDIGWVVQSHGLLYAQEYGWDESFEAMVAAVAADFINKFDPKRERCWIAERDGETVGSAFVVTESEHVAKLRLVIVAPSARGLGIGKRLVQEAIQFAKFKRYSTLTLWTNDVLTAARHIYKQAGFHLVRSEPHHSFGQDLIGEYWKLKL